MLVFTMDDRGGWFEHETGEIKWIGSLAETIDWIYTELLANREPERFSRRSLAYSQVHYAFTFQGCFRLNSLAPRCR